MISSINSIEQLPYIKRSDESIYEEITDEKIQVASMLLIRLHSKIHNGYILGAYRVRPEKVISCTYYFEIFNMYFVQSNPIIATPDWMVEIYGHVRLLIVPLYSVSRYKYPKR